MTTRTYGRAPRPDTKFTWIDGLTTLIRLAMVAAAIILATTPALPTLLYRF
jgi:hypothetical protein